LETENNPNIVIVSKSKIPDKITGLPRICKYSDVPKDPCEWVYNLSYMPIPYDLMQVRIKDSRYIKSAWWTGKLWKGLRLKPPEIIIAWKRNHDFE